MKHSASALLRRLIAACCMPVLVGGLLPAVQSQDAVPPVDPVPIQRVLLSADRLPAELEKAKRGVLIQLPRADFEDRVKKAVLAGEALKSPPRLVEARYMARLVDTALEGSAEWKIVNPGAGPGILPVQPLNLALRQVRWSDNREVLLADWQPKETGLLVEPSGPSSLTLDWSARSVPAGGHLRFSLETPAAALAALELDLPADRAVSVSRESCLVSGPHPAADAGRRTWRLSFAGVSQVNFEVRRAGAGLPAPLVLAPVQSKFELTPGQLQADFDFDLDVMHAPIKEVRCECPPTLRPYDVQVRHLEGWELRPGAKGAPGLLVVRLREPIQKGLLQVRCLAPLVSGSVWTAPAIKVLNGVPRGETLQLRVHPDLLMEDWQPGGFRVTRANFQADGWQVLTLAAGIDAGPNPARPAARLQTPGPEFKVRQLAWWQIGAQSSLTAQLTYDVVHGRLFALPLTVPTGWEVEHVELQPADLLRHWTPLQDKGKTILQVELQRALDPAASARMTVKLRPMQPLKLPAGGLNVPIPDLAPVGARLREGALAVSVASLYQAVPTASVAAVPLEIAEERGADPKTPRPPAPRPPWGQQTVDYYFPYQGQPVAGTVQLRSRPLQLRARCTSDVVIASGRAIQVTRLELAPEVDNPQTVDLFVSDPAAQDWDWKTVRGGNPVADVEHYRAAEFAPQLAVLAARTPLQALGPLVAQRRGSWQRLRFAQPLTEPVTVEATVELTDAGLGPDPVLRLAVLGSARPLEALVLAATSHQLTEQSGRQRAWEVPLVTVPAAHRLDGQVTLLLAGADLIQVTGDGLLEVVDARKSDPVRGPAGATGLPASASSWRTFRYGHPPVSLRLRGGLPSADRSTEVAADQVRLTTTLAADGRLVHQFRFRLWNWQQQHLPVRLPAGATLQAVRCDGRWLGQLPAGETHDGLTAFELPVAGGAPRHQFELIYTTEQPAWVLWTTLPAPVPVLPVRLVSLRRTWRLPASVAPLSEATLSRLPGGVEETGSPLDERWNWFSSTDSWVPGQEQDLADAAASLRRQYKSGDEWTLGRAVERFDFEFLKNFSLIVDAEALQAAGVTPNSLLSASAWERAPRAGQSPPPPWASLGLVCVPCRAAPLLTTRQQLASWQSSAASGVPGAGVQEALAEALAFGHDRSGRFRTVADWLHQGERQVGGTGGAGEWASSFGPLGNDECEWELLAGTAGGDRLTVVHRRLMPVMGWALAGVALLVAVWQPPQNERRRRRLTLLWLLLTGAALLWFPAALRPMAWPAAFAGLAVALLWEVRSPRLLPSAGAPRAAAAALLVMLAVAGLPAQVAAPTVSTVYLVPESGGAGKQQVLAPPALLDQLQTLARRGPAGQRGAALLRADYEGQAERQSVAFKAHFQVWCFGDEPTSLTIPLSSVQLTEAQVDGAAAFPTVVKQPREGYRFRLQGRGLHTIVLWFGVPQPATTEERDVRFNIPELHRSRLRLRVPAPVGYLHAVEARGSQRLSGDASQQQLEADLGAVGQLRARWRTDELKPGQATVGVQESYYWDLQTSAARLLAVLQYTVEKGWDKDFTIDVPQELEVLSVEAGPLPGGPPAPRLKEWQLRPQEQNFKRLRLEFASPVTQSVQVTVELAPRQPFGRTTTLPLPLPRDARPSQGFLAYRTVGLEAQMTQHNAIIGIDDRPGLMSAFAEHFSQPWRFARQEDIEMPTRAFWRAKGGFLHLALKPATAPATCVQEISWRIEPQQAVLRATARAKSADTALSFVEWRVPDALQIIEVVGANVHHWTRAGGRLQVWLQKPVAEANLQLTGWLPRPPKEQLQFNLPPIHLLDMQKQTTTVRVSVGEGVTVTPGKLQNLLHLPEASTAGRDWTYLAEQDNYGGAFATASATATADFRLLTFAEVQDRELRFIATLDCSVKSGELRNLTVAVRNWDGGELYLNSPDVARRLEQRQGPLGRSWVLDLKPGVNRRYQLTVTGKLPLGAAPAVFLPDVRVETSGTGPIRLQRWLAVAGSELAAEDASELAPAADPAALLQPSWPGEAERLRKAGGQAWRVLGNDWRLRLRLRSAPPRTGTVKVFLTERAAVVADGQRWQHQAVYWLWHEAGSDLNLSLPAGAALLGVAIDGVGVPPLQPSTDRLWLPLPGGAGIRKVLLTWNYPPGQEDLEQPNLAGPKLESVGVGPTIWTVALPVGFQSGRRWSGGRAPAESVRVASSAGLELARADAQLRMLRWLADQARDTGDFSTAGQALAAQDRFERFCRRADYQVQAPVAAADAGPRGQSLISWLQELREQDAELTKSQTYQALRAEPRLPAAPGAPPSGIPWQASPLEQGRPLCWQAAGDAVPLFRLLPDSATRNRQAVSLSVLLIVLLFAAWVLGRSFKSAAWPEQVGLLGAIGLVLFGGGWAWLLLLLPGVWLGYRLQQLARWLHARLPTRGAPDPSTPGSLAGLQP
ncbi:MAG: hypothetical protein JNM56_28315 [Planctomycetia bacterium]|nr:hypothetical protein [Planctomycetia bacterium]